MELKTIAELFPGYKIPGERTEGIIQRIYQETGIGKESETELHMAIKQPGLLQFINALAELSPHPKYFRLGYLVGYANTPEDQKAVELTKGELGKIYKPPIDLKHLEEELKIYSPGFISSIEKEQQTINQNKPGAGDIFYQAVVLTVFSFYSRFNPEN